MTGRRGYWASAAALPPAQWAMIGLLLVAVILANMDQPYPELAPLQHVPTVLLALAAPLLLRRWPLSTGSVAAIWVFLLLHTLGGRYIYSYVPYDDWSRALTGHSLSDLLGWSRNHYDRFIHFAFGLLWTLPVREALVRRHGVAPSLGLFIGFGFVALIGAVYEIFEWALTIAVAADMADSYNGQQGDPWDPQKDMVMAQIGSVAAILWAKVKRA
jgi:putative membrane protein